jgi:hypothetical protein
MMIDLITFTQLIYSFRAGGSGSNAPDLALELLGPNRGRVPTVHDGGFLWKRIVPCMSPRIEHDHFLLNPFQFITH